MTGKRLNGDRCLSSLPVEEGLSLKAGLGDGEETERKSSSDAISGREQPDERDGRLSFTSGKPIRGPGKRDGGNGEEVEENLSSLKTRHFVRKGLRWDHLSP